MPDTASNDRALASAKYWLQIARTNDPTVIDLTLRALKEAGADPGRIGSNQAELNALSRAAEVERLHEQMEELRAEAGIDPANRTIPLAKRIVAEGLEEAPERNVPDSRYLANWLRDIRDGLFRLRLDEDVLGDAPDDPGERSTQDEQILEAACDVVSLTNRVFTWASQDENAEDEDLSEAIVREEWQGIVMQLTIAGSGLKDLNLDDACLDRLLLVRAFRPLSEAWHAAKQSLITQFARCQRMLNTRDLDDLERRMKETSLSPADIGTTPEALRVLRTLAGKVALWRSAA